MNKTLVLIALLFTTGLCYCQEDDERGNFIYASANITRTFSGKVLPSSGLHSSLGFNVARVFKRKFVLGPLIEFRVFKDLGTNRHYDRIRDDVNSNIILNQGNPTDSTRAAFLYRGFNPSNNIDFYGSHLLTYGLMYSPFPNKYGGFMLQVKRGKYLFPIYGAYQNKYIQNGESENVDFKVPITLNIQLTCKPFAFFSPSEKNNHMITWRNLLLSIFYESISLRRATVDQAPLTRFLKAPFFDKYGSASHVGFKVSFGIY